MQVRTDFQSKLFQSNFVYYLLRTLKPRLAVDVGAAMGSITALIKHVSPESRVFSFEPFPGNWPLFEENTKTLSDVELFRNAIGKEDGSRDFLVRHVVSGSEAGWETRTGYSSVGQFVEYASGGYEAAQVQSTDVRRLDSIIRSEVDFTKIDVQGAEHETLLSTENIPLIKLIYIEFSGDKDVLRWLFDHGYTVYDTDYVVFGGDGEFAKAYLTDLEQKNLSVGSSATFGHLGDAAPRDLDGYCEFMRKLGGHKGSLQTDLIAVHPDYVEEFDHALAIYTEGRKKALAAQERAAAEPPVVTPIAVAAAAQSEPSAGKRGSWWSRKSAR